MSTARCLLINVLKLSHNLTGDFTKIVWENSLKNVFLNILFEIVISKQKNILTFSGIHLFCTNPR